MTSFHVELEACLPNLRRWCLHLTRNAEQADDLLQETALRALERAHLFKPGTNFRGWINTIAINVFRNSIRANRHNVALEDLPPVFSCPDRQGPRDAVHDLEGMLARLSPDQLEIVMAAADGLHYDELSAELGIPVNTVRSLLCRARQALERMQMEAMAVT